MKLAPIDPLATPKRIAFAGDWHGNTQWARKAIEYARNNGADVIVHVGDFAYDFRAAYLRTLNHSPVPILFVDGNHEDFDLLDHWKIGENGLRQISERVWHLPRGFRWNWGGVLFMACGGAYSVDRRFRTQGQSWWRQEEITPEDAAECQRGGKVEVLISHDCPSGVVIPTIDDRAEDPAWIRSVDLASASAHRRILREIVDKVEPHSIWHGHYHTAYTQEVDLPYGQVRVTGLDCDETTIDGNVQIINLSDIRSHANRRREEGSTA